MAERFSSLAAPAKPREGDAPVLAVALLLPRPARAWHGWLDRQLRERGVAVTLLDGQAAAPGRRYGALLWLDARLGRRSEALRPVALAADPDGGDGARIVLDGSAPRGGDLVPLFDGEPGEHQLLACLAGGGRPRLAAARAGAEGLAILGEAVPALRDPAVLSRSLDDCLDRLATLLAAAVTGAPHHPPALAAPEPTVASVAGFALRGLGGKAWRRLARREEHWRILARGDDGRDRALADDGRRYYADPFPLVHEGRLHVFFEDLDLASRHGVISACVLGGDGFSPPRTVLARPYHLSYPQVFAEGGAVYMLPESSAVRRLELWRAERVPDRWVLDAVLLDGLAVADATLVRHEGRYWIAAASAEPGGTGWDRLLLFHAEALRGPWRAHRLNPILVDAAAARPAGGMWHEAGTLMRVAMDCRGGYGDGVNLFRVDRLDPDGFRQTFVRSLAVPPGADGMHSFNRCAGHDFVDLRSHGSRRWRRVTA